MSADPVADLAGRPPPFQGDRLRVGWFMYLQCAPALRVWTGVGDFQVPADGVDTTGGIYKGIGKMVTLTELKIPINGHFAQHELSVAAPDAASMGLINADRASVRFATVSVGLVELDEDYQPLGPVTWLWDAVCDGPRVTRQGNSKGATRVISLSCAAGETQRKRALLGRWTGVDQRARFPGDAFCDRTNLYDDGTTEIWPT